MKIQNLTWLKETFYSPFMQHSIIWIDELIFSGNDSQNIPIAIYLGKWKKKKKPSEEHYAEWKGTQKLKFL